MYGFNDTRWIDTHTHTHTHIPATAGHVEKWGNVNESETGNGTKNAPINGAMFSS